MEVLHSIIVTQLVWSFGLMMVVALVLWVALIAIANFGGNDE